MSADRQCVVFRIDQTEYALPIGIVQEVIRYITPALTGASGAESQGVIDLRGRVVPVSNLAARLGDPRSVRDADASSKIVIVDVNGSWQGLIVDRVDEVLTIGAHHLHPAPLETGGSLDCIANFDGRIVMLLDVHRLLAGPSRHTSPVAA